MPTFPEIMFWIALAVSASIIIGVIYAFIKKEEEEDNDYWMHGG